jgi:hypothetical protein
MPGFRTSLNKGAEQEPISVSEFRGTPHLAPPPPLKLWRTCKPELLSSGDVGRLRKTLVGTTLPWEPDWKRAILGDVAVAIGIAVRQLKFHRITDPEIDLALSAVLACAIEGDAAAAVLVSWALRRRSKKFKRCHRLSMLWLKAKF